MASGFNATPRRRIKPVLLPGESTAVVRLTQFKRRPARVACPAPYAPLWVDLWANPPVRLIRAATPTTSVSEYLAPLVLAWNLTDDAGAVLACTAETVAELPIDLQTYLLGEVQQIIMQPLAVSD